MIKSCHPATDPFFQARCAPGYIGYYYYIYARIVSKSGIAIYMSSEDPMYVCSPFAVIFQVARVPTSCKRPPHTFHSGPQLGRSTTE